MVNNEIPKGFKYYLGCCKRCGQLLENIPYSVERHRGSCKVCIEDKENDFVIIKNEQRLVLSQSIYDKRVQLIEEITHIPQSELIRMYPEQYKEFERTRKYLFFSEYLTMEILGGKFD